MGVPSRLRRFKRLSVVRCFPREVTDMPVVTFCNVYVVFVLGIFRSQVLTIAVTGVFFITVNLSILSSPSAAFGLFFWYSTFLAG